MNLIQLLKGVSLFPLCFPLYAVGIDFWNSFDSGTKNLLMLMMLYQ